MLSTPNRDLLAGWMDVDNALSGWFGSHPDQADTGSGTG
jgi:hypothetical protein